MDQITMDGAQMLASYGALGVVTGYFIFKDYKLTKELTSALSDFKITLALVKDKVGL